MLWEKTVTELFLASSLYDCTYYWLAYNMLNQKNCYKMYDQIFTPWNSFKNYDRINPIKIRIISISLQNKIRRSQMVRTISKLQ